MQEAMKISELIQTTVLCCTISAVAGAFAGALISRHYEHGIRDEVITRRLLVIDSSGSARAVIDTDSSGEVSLRLADSGDQAQLLLGIVKRSRSELAHPGPNGEEEQVWTPVMRLSDMTGRTTVDLETKGHGNGLLRFLGAESPSGVDLGFIGDSRDDGTFGAAWGLRASRNENATGVGVLGYDSPNPLSIVPPPPAVARRNASR
jgi:hypothetical protein